MKKLILVMLTLAFAMIFSFHALAKPEQAAATKFNPQITVTTESHTDFIIFSLKGATKIGDTYHIYYTTYDRDEQKTNPEWLTKNGKMVTAKTEEDLDRTKMIEIDNTLQKPDVTPGIYYTITLVDTNGNESKPTPVKIEFLKPSTY